MVVPNLKYGIKRLVLWAEDTTAEEPGVVGEVGVGEILTVVEVRRQDAECPNYNEEWRDGACRVLAPGGELGWVGAGWLKRVTT
jgi:hypothetical protein